jgi:putative flippase GtrA
LLAALGIVANGALVGLLTIATLHYLIAQAISTVIILVLNFVVTRTWIFPGTF